MRAKILLLIILATVAFCIVGIIITAWEHDIFNEVGGIIIAVSMLIFLFGLYIVVLLLKKQKILWIIVFTWFALWAVSFILNTFTAPSDFSSGVGPFINIVTGWPLFVYENFWGYSRFAARLDSYFGLICVHSLITAFLCIGALVLKRPKKAGDKENKTLTEKINNEAE